MAHGEFIWCDLSAYEPDKAMSFYASVFGWSWQRETGEGMHIALCGGTPNAALYQMPEKFMQMGMPSFWMSYIAVNDVAAAVATARKMGGKVELGPEEFPGGGRYALIRDPLGAGFTVLEGETGAPVSGAPGARAGHGLFVSDAQAIIPFYEALFGWSFDTGAGGVRPVRLGGKTLFHCHEIPDPAVRGKEQYWAVLFVQSRPLSEIARNGGHIETKLDLPEGRAVLARDPHGAAFILLKGGDISRDHQPTDIPWLGWLGLVLIGVSVFTQHLWPWTIFLGVWVYQGIQNQQTFLLQPVRRDSHAVLYWILMLAFAAMAIVSAAYPFGV